jgi:hypothetical protein
VWGWGGKNKNYCSEVRKEKKRKENNKGKSSTRF